jgi:hypothetical protein
MLLENHIHDDLNLVKSLLIEDFEAFLFICMDYILGYEEVASLVAAPNLDPTETSATYPAAFKNLRIELLNVYSVLWKRLLF